MFLRTRKEKKKNQKRKSLRPCACAPGLCTLCSPPAPPRSDRAGWRTAPVFPAPAGGWNSSACPRQPWRRRPGSGSQSRAPRRHVTHKEPRGRTGTRVPREASHRPAGKARGHAQTEPQAQQPVGEAQESSGSKMENCVPQNPTAREGQSKLALRYRWYCRSPARAVGLCSRGLRDEEGELQETEFQLSAPGVHSSLRSSEQGPGR